MRCGRTTTGVCHILLLPAGLAVGLGREVGLPYRLDELSGFAPKTWVPRFSVWVSENSAVGRMEL